MLILKISFRNILRNRRRSLMTGSAVAAGALGMLLFGGFVRSGFRGLETMAVQQKGHLAVSRTGYFTFGAGNPAAYGIDEYQQVMRVIAHDPVLQPMIHVITPIQSVMGIAGYYSGSSNASKTFIGVGVIPSDRNRMRQWDEFGTGAVHPPDPLLSDKHESRGVIGVGLARVLGMCAAMAVPSCPSPPTLSDEPPNSAPPVNREIADLARRETARAGRDPRRVPEIDLLAATAGGAPNVVALEVSGVEAQSVKEVDDSYVLMPLGLAQELVYGRGRRKVTSIVIQLHRSEDLAAARDRLKSIIRQNHFDLEVHDFKELMPLYVQVVGMLSMMYFFLALVIAVIVLFAVINTMSMSVMERTNEIGTIRAMGVHRSGIRSQFIAEGFLIGAMGAVTGTALALIGATLFNHLDLTWVPPGNAHAVPFRLAVLGGNGLLLGVGVGLVAVATLAALIPARRAARLLVVDALRHV